MGKAYLARRDGDEPVSYWHPSLEPALAETLGIIVFQERVLRVAMDLAGFSGSQADLLRRSMSRKRSYEAMEDQRGAFLAGARERGVDETVADTVFTHLLGFASYGFCKSHAAAFAQTAYDTLWLRAHYPAEYYCGVLNNEPMGFYAPAQIVRDAQEHGVDYRDVAAWNGLANPSAIKEGQSLRVAPPAQPNVRVSPLDGAVVLDWGWDTAAVAATEGDDGSGFVFEGYNLYQLPSANASLAQGTRVGTYDLENGVATILGIDLDQESGVILDVPLQIGSDARPGERLDRVGR